MSSLLIRQDLVPLVAGYVLVMGALAAGLRILRCPASESGAGTRRPAAPGAARTPALRPGRDAAAASRAWQNLRARTRPGPGWTRLIIHLAVTAAGGYLMLVAVVILCYYGVARGQPVPGRRGQRLRAAARAQHARVPGGIVAGRTQGPPVGRGGKGVTRGQCRVRLRAASGPMAAASTPGPASTEIRVILDDSSLCLAETDAGNFRHPPGSGGTLLSWHQGFWRVSLSLLFNLPSRDLGFPRLLVGVGPACHGAWARPLRDHVFSPKTHDHQQRP
jgi:hypothetical protein